MINDENTFKWRPARRTGSAARPVDGVSALQTHLNRCVVSPVGVRVGFRQPLTQFRSFFIRYGQASCPPR